MPPVASWPTGPCPRFPSQRLRACQGVGVWTGHADDRGRVTGSERTPLSVRSEARLQAGGTRKPVLLSYLENSKYDIPGTSPDEMTPGGLVPGYARLDPAVGCVVRARLYLAGSPLCLFPRPLHRLGGLRLPLLGWVCLVLMLVLLKRSNGRRASPARSAGKLPRGHYRDVCKEHCGSGTQRPHRTARRSLSRRSRHRTRP